MEHRSASQELRYAVLTVWAITALLAAACVLALLWVRRSMQLLVAPSQRSRRLP